jgi:hypothetical protein
MRLPDVVVVEVFEDHLRDDRVSRSARPSCEEVAVHYFEAPGGRVTTVPPPCAGNGLLVQVVSDSGPAEVEQNGCELARPGADLDEPAGRAPEACAHVSELEDRSRSKDRLSHRPIVMSVVTLRP